MTSIRKMGSRTKFLASMGLIPMVCAVTTYKSPFAEQTNL